MKITAESVFKERDLLCQETAAERGIGAKVWSLSLYAVAGCALYGVTMGLNHSVLQACVSAIKVPILFLLTLAVCLPTLHFIGLFFGSTIKFRQSLIILLAGISLTSILLAAFAPISLFFLASGSTYPFLLLMHVIIFAFCGAAGLYSVHRNFTSMPKQATDGTGPSLANHVLTVWMLLYMFVGTQTAYILSPFINPTSAFSLFGQSGGNFYSYLWSVLSEALNK
jgi:hypothetical protein